MKRKILLLAGLLFSTFCFAASNKWTPTDLFFPKKAEKIFEKYNLTEVFTEGTTSFYRNEENDDWLIMFKQGDEARKDESIYIVAFGSLGDVFDSCTITGALLNAEHRDPYLYAAISESSTSVKEGNFDYNSQALWKWGDTQAVFLNLCRYRLSFFNWLKTKQQAFNIIIPDEDLERYEYFTEWFNQNKNDPKLKKIFAKEYKDYLANHK